MKKYLLFCFEQYEARGGFSDFVNSFDSIQEVEAQIHIIKPDFYQIVDRDTSGIIQENNCNLNMTDEGERIYHE